MESVEYGTWIRALPANIRKTLAYLSNKNKDWVMKKESVKTLKMVLKLFCFLMDAQAN